jgi:hypothetical protein
VINLHYIYILDTINLSENRDGEGSLMSPNSKTVGIWALIIVAGLFIAAVFAAQYPPPVYAPAPTPAVSSVR